MPTATIQQKFNFEEGTYGLKIFKNKDDVKVILSELAINAGPSITNAFEKIATQIYRRFLAESPINTITWIEHYNKESYSNSGAYPDSLDEVTLVWNPKTRRFRNPQWRPCPASDYRLLGLQYSLLRPSETPTR
jgi:hypothetical protein